MSSTQREVSPAGNREVGCGNVVDDWLRSVQLCVWQCQTRPMWMLFMMTSCLINCQTFVNLSLQITPVWTDVAFHTYRSVRTPVWRGGQWRGPAENPFMCLYARNCEKQNFQRLFLRENTKVHFCVTV